ncbi:hypothetical protein SNEBB_004922 [Seison nebaliae]|nr:hypothetical protein SNEBB_004922 [Seison nebaliae]
MHLIADESLERINLVYHFKRSYGHFPRNANNSAVILDSSTSYATVQRANNHLLMSAFIGMGVLGVIAIIAIVVNIYYIWTSSRSGHHLKKKAISRLSTHPRNTLEENPYHPQQQQQQSQQHHHHMPHKYARQSYVNKGHDVNDLSQNWNNKNLKLISNETKLNLENKNRNNHSDNANKLFVNLLDDIFTNLENPKVMMENKKPMQPIIVGGPVVREELELNWVLK